MPLYEIENAKQAEAIEELRMRMKNCMNSEMYESSFTFYRFLKARNFDIDKAEDMLRKHLVFRKVYKLDTIMQDFTPKEAFKYIQPSYIGEDKEGTLVIYTNFGNIEVRDIINCFKIHEYYKHWIWAVEEKRFRYFKRNNKTGKFTGKCIIIVDLENLKISTALHPASADHLSFLSINLQDNYPETLQHMFLINAPAFYVLAYSLVKSVIATEVIRKLHFYGTSGWKEDLVKLLGADVLPSFMGGNRTDPDGNPMCNTFVNRAGRIPSKYHLSKEDRSFRDESRVKRVRIMARSRINIPVEITEHGCVIEWEFEVENKDIQCALYFRESETKHRDIVPLFKYRTPDGTYESSYTCQYVGTYIIVFDNTYSRFHPKDVSYCITIKNTEE